MRYVVVILCVLMSLQTWAGITTDSASKTDTTYNEPVLYPEGAFFSIGTLINNRMGYSFSTGALMGNKRVKVGFTMGFNSVWFEDTVKVKTGNNTSTDSPNAAINSLSIGFASKVYNQAGAAYLSTAGCFVLPTYDNRFMSTNGLSLSMALGIIPNPKSSSTVYLEMGFMHTAFATKTNERPNAFSVMLNIGVIL